MPKDASPLVLERVQRYTIGFPRAGGDPAALGSGVLSRIGDTRGILTCAHVEASLQEIGTVGVVGFLATRSFSGDNFEFEDRAAQPPRIVSQGLGRVAHITGAVHEREEQ